MTSGKQARRQRQAQVARPPVRSTQGRKANRNILLLAALGPLGIAVALILILAFNGHGSSSPSATGSTLQDANFITRQFHGIPQSGLTLGKATAPVTMVEYIDLQCPVCRDFETNVMPTILSRYVRTGKVRVVARPVVVIGSDSEKGRRGMIAAGQQNRAFNFSQLLYFNQGVENSGWLNDTMVASAARSIPGVDVKQLQSAINSSAVVDQTKTVDNQAQADNLSGTPTILVGRTGGTLRSFPAGNPGLGPLSAAITNALASKS